MIETIRLELIPIVVALVSVVKIYLPQKYAPLYSLTISLLLTFGSQISQLTIENGFSIFIQGILLGLAASGLYCFPGVKGYESKMKLKQKR